MLKGQLVAMSLQCLEILYVANYKFNGKVLNGLYSYELQDLDRKNRLFNPKDNSGNNLVAGMEVLYLSGVKYGSPSKVKLIEIKPDGETFTVVGFQQKNGQYSTVANCNCYLLTSDFIALHPKL